MELQQKQVQHGSLIFTPVWVIDVGAVGSPWILYFYVYT